MNDLISIIVPVYNTEKYLKKCLDSILSQTYRNFEVILVNDGSTDNSSLICEHYKQKDKRVKYFFKINGGLSSARNFGLDLCKGQYICFVDSDDYIDKNYLKLLYKNAILYNTDLTICRNNILDHNVIKDNLYLSDIRVFPRVISAKEFWDEYYFKRIKKDTSFGFVYAWNKLYKRHLFDKYRFKRIIHEDEFALTYLISNSDKICLIDNRLYTYRANRTNSITVKSRNNSFDYIIFLALLDRIKFFFKISYDKKIIAVSYKILLQKYSDLSFLLNLKYRLIVICLGIKLFLRNISFEKIERKYLAKSFLPILYKIRKKVKDALIK